jgi:hypothetical protein
MALVDPGANTVSYATAAGIAEKNRERAHARSRLRS